MAEAGKIFENKMIKEPPARLQKVILYLPEGLALASRDKSENPRAEFESLTQDEQQALIYAILEEKLREDLEQALKASDEAERRLFPRLY